MPQETVKQTITVPEIKTIPVNIIIDKTTRSDLEIMVGKPDSFRVGEGYQSLSYYYKGHTKYHLIVTGNDFDPLDSIAGGFTVYIRNNTIKSVY
jgi:hypothetical protein